MMQLENREMSIQMENSAAPKWSVNFLCMIAFFLPLIQGLSIVCMVLLVFNRLVIAKNRKTILPNFKGNKSLWILPLFYLFHVFALLWSQNLKYGGLDIQTKASFLLLPLFIGTIVLNEKDIQKVMKSFIVACFLASILLLLNATVSFVELSDYKVFFYTDYSKAMMHPTYISMYFNLALLFSFHLFSLEKKSSHSKFFSVLQIFFFIQLILLSARTAQAVALLSFIVAAFYYYKGGLLTTGKRAHVIVILMVSIASYFVLHSFYNRYTQVESAITDAAVHATTQVYNSSTGRLEIWKEGLSVLSENWMMGTGTGDVKDELLKSYAKHNFTYGLDRKLNAHNQFLQTWIALGVLGFSLLCLSLYKAFSRPKDEFYTLFILFALVIVLNSMTESILEVQKGVLFMAFMYSLFILPKKSSIQIENSNFDL